MRRRRPRPQARREGRVTVHRCRRQSGKARRGSGAPRLGPCARASRRSQPRDAPRCSHWDTDGADVSTPLQTRGVVGLSACNALLLLRFYSSTRTGDLRIMF